MSNKPFDITGRTAIITGGNGGIGLGIATGLALAGANIVIAARNNSKTQDAVKHIEHLGVRAVGLNVDVEDNESISQMIETAIEKTGPVTILVNNAGIGI